MARRGGRSLPPGDEPWKTFTVSVRETRGDSRVYAVVALSSVTGRVGPLPERRIVWEGWLGHRLPGEHLTPEVAAEYAARALEEAYPGLF